MVFWVNQAILGFTLLIAALSLWRMGPAFKRSQFAGPVAFLGLTMMIFLPKQPLYFEPDFYRCEHFTLCNNDGREAFQYILTWTLIPIFAAFIGCYSIIQGSNYYGNKRTPRLLFGWVALAVSWWAIWQREWFLAAYTQFDVLLLMVSTLIGIALTIILFFYVIRFTERRTKKDPPIEPLDAREQRLVTEMIRRNLGGES